MSDQHRLNKQFTQLVGVFSAKFADGGMVNRHAISQPPKVEPVNQCLFQLMLLLHCFCDTDKCRTFKTNETGMIDLWIGEKLCQDLYAKLMFMMGQMIDGLIVGLFERMCWLWFHAECWQGIEVAYDAGQLIFMGYQTP